MNEKNSGEDFIWAVLLHLGMNMWDDKKAPRLPIRDYLQCEDAVWRDVTQAMHDVGLNMVVVDLGEGMVFTKHPELAVRGSWSQDKMKRELDRLRGLGLEPIPKLNFSSHHDGWLGEYQFMLSTEKYYQVVSDVINEAIDVFGNPRFMHLGWDEEENYEIQKNRELILMRQGDLWWHDFMFTVHEVEKRGVRAWVWADHSHGHWDEWNARCPKGVLVSNSYYGRTFDESKADVGYVKPGIRAYHELDKAGYDQIPCGTNWVPGYYRDRHLKSNDVNFPLTVMECRRIISSTRLKGFLMAPWEVTDTKRREWLLHAVDLVGQSMKI